MSHIYLTGFMGAGKSTVGMELAAQTGRRLIDTDQRITQQAGKSISEIFAQDGEDAFRRLETACIRALGDEEDAVVSLGGGAVMRPENVAAMKQNGLIILLDATPEVILERVSRNNRRPVLEGKKDIVHIREMMQERMPAYRAAADLRVRTDTGGIPDVARQIIGLTKLQ